MSSTYYISTPIYYVNARPHLGHAYSTIVADVLQRFYSTLGEKTFFLTGTDEHGEKIIQAAEAAGYSTQEFVDSISRQFQNLWPQLNITYDAFIRTTDLQHKEAVQKFLQHIYDTGDIYFGEFGGYYCLGCERFYTEKELEDGFCPQHKTKPEFIEEQNYFFKMSKYLPWLVEYLQQHPNLIRPERYKNEVLSLLESGALEDLCISRPKTRLPWGIELPFDTNYVCYVWFDALISYISALNWPNGECYKTFWPGEHLIAKDILKPHAIFWPTMLKSAGLPIYKHLNVHGYWLNRDTKMSKSLDNAIDPITLIQQYGLDAFRYFLIREMNFGSDANFSEESLKHRINADLANDLGNLFNRVLSMSAKYFKSLLPEAKEYTEPDMQLRQLTENAQYNYIQLMKNMRLSQAVEALWELIRALNKYIDTQAPWKLFKEGQIDRLNTVIRLTLECMRKVAISLWPIMPEITITMLKQLGISTPKSKKYGVMPTTCISNDIHTWDQLTTGTILASTSNLFPRIELKEEISDKENKMSLQSNESQPSISEQEEISFNDFQKIEIRIGTIIEASKHPNADNLLCFSIDIGENKPRQILSGIAQHFTPESMLGKQVCVVTNLTPKKIRGIESQGMILFAKTPSGLSLVTVESPVPTGSIVS